MTHPYNDHSGAAHYIQTGKIWQVPDRRRLQPHAQATGRRWARSSSTWPSTSPADRRATCPATPCVPNSLGRLQEAGQYLRPGEHAGWLGRRYNPLTTVVDKKDLQDNPYWRDCRDEELTFQIEGLAPGEGLRLDRMNRRVSLLAQFDAGAAAAGPRDPRRATSTASASGPSRLATSEATREALDIRREEPPPVRDRYGRHLFGQSALVARRLVEAGVRFVTVHYDACDGYGWDSHVHSDDVKNHLMPTFDQALAALLTDLDERGLLAETLVVALGEMGRTPLADAAVGPRPLEHPLPRRPRRRRRPRRHHLRPLRQGRRPPRRPPRQPREPGRHDLRGPRHLARAPPARPAGPADARSCRMAGRSSGTWDESVPTTAPH